MEPTTEIAGGPAGAGTGAPAPATIARAAFSIGLLLWGGYGLSHAASFTIMDSVDLAIHETGHLVFSPFGEFITVAGGTIMQLLLPAVFAAHFWRRDDGYGASVALWWVAQSAGNVATYAADARAQELPLVGGGEHDWAYLLGETGLLVHDQQIGRVIRGGAFALMLGATAWGVIRAAAAPGPEA